MAIKIFTPQRVYGFKKLLCSEAKIIFNAYVDSIDFLPFHLKEEIKNCYKTTPDNIERMHICFKNLHNFFQQDEIKKMGFSYSNGDMFEIIAPLIMFKDSDTISYLKSGAVGIDCVVNNSLVQLKYLKGVNSGVIGYMKLYEKLKKEYKTQYYDEIYKNLLPLTKNKKNIIEKIFMVINNIGKSIYINGIEVTKEHQEFISKCCPSKDDVDPDGKRSERIKQIYEFMITTYGENVFETYEKSFEDNQPLWESYKKGLIKKPQKCFLDYKKYDAFVLHMIYNLFEDLLNDCYNKEINDLVQYVSKQYNIKLLKCDDKKLILLDMETIEVRVNSKRYYGGLNYHGAGTISIEFLGV